MKLFIKRDKTVDDSLFVVLDEECNEKYYVTGSKSTIYLTDLSETVLMKIKQLPLPALRAYSITAYNRNIKFILNSNPTAVNCYYYGNSWHIRGDVFTKSFDIIDADNSLVATHCLRYSKSGDGVELNVFAENRELFCIATAICVNLDVKINLKKAVTV